VRPWRIAYQRALAHLRTELVVDALDMARWRGKPVAPSCIPTVASTLDEIHPTENPAET
jgi:hypothetical protein